MIDLDEYNALSGDEKANMLWDKDTYLTMHNYRSIQNKPVHLE